MKKQHRRRRSAERVCKSDDDTDRVWKKPAYPRHIGGKPGTIRRPGQEHRQVADEARGRPELSLLERAGRASPDAGRRSFRKDRRPLLNVEIGAASAVLV